MSEIREPYPPIKSTEVVLLTFDFGFIAYPNGDQSGFIDAVESVTCSVFGNPSLDINPSSHLLSDAYVVSSLPLPNGSGMKKAAVIQELGGLIPGVTYLIRCIVSTTDNQVLCLFTHVTCSDDV